MAFVAKYSGEEFIRRQVGMVTEVLTKYGPVNRFWYSNIFEYMMMSVF